MESARTTANQRETSHLVLDRTDAVDFDREIGHLARRLRFSVANLSDADRGLLDEFGRGASKDGEARYRLVTFRRLCAIARRSRKSEDREALAEIVRAEILTGLEPTPVEVAFDLETTVTGPSDIEQRRFERQPNPITFARCRAALQRQLAATRTALDALMSHPKVWL